MTVTLDIRGDIKPVLRSLEQIERRHVPKATVRGINKASDVVVKGTASEVGKDLNLAAVRLKKRFDRRGDVKGKRFQVIKARGSRLAALLIVYLRGIPVRQLTRVRQTKRGVRAEGGRFYRGAFINRAPSGQEHVFRRAGYFEDEGKPGQRRKPINVLKVPVGTRLKTKAARLLRTEGRAAFVKEFERQMRLALKGQGGF